MSEPEKPKRKRAKKRPLAAMYAALEMRVNLAKQILRGGDASPEGTVVRRNIALDVLDDTKPLEGRDDVEH